MTIGEPPSTGTPLNGAHPGTPYDGWFYTNVLKPLFLGNMYEDMQRMENVLEASGIDYTIVRPPYLTKGPPTGAYRVQRHENFRDDKSLSRGNLAHFLLRAATEPGAFSRMKVAISN